MPLVDDAEAQHLEVSRAEIFLGCCVPVALLWAEAGQIWNPSKGFSEKPKSNEGQKIGVAVCVI